MPERTRLERLRAILEKPYVRLSLAITAVILIGLAIVYIYLLVAILYVLVSLFGTQNVQLF